MLSLIHISLRASSIKFVGAVALSVAVLIALVALIPETGVSESRAADAQGVEYVYSGIKTNEDRIKFLEQFGVSVDPAAVEEEEIKIPDTFDKVYMGYNEIQRAQGLSLIHISLNLTRAPKDLIEL